MKPQPNNALNGASSQSEHWLETVRRQVDSIRFGVVQVAVHDGRVVQVETTEKVRFDLRDTRQN